VLLHIPFSLLPFPFFATRYPKCLFVVGFLNSLLLLLLLPSFPDSSKPKIFSIFLGYPKCCWVVVGLWKFFLLVYFLGLHI
jgi:hypothetical protein